MFRFHSIERLLWCFNSRRHNCQKLFVTIWKNGLRMCMGNGSNWSRHHCCSMMLVRYWLLLLSSSSLLSLSSLQTIIC